MDSLETQLIAAIRDSDLNLVEKLLDKGCKVDVGDADALTPLHLAADRGRLEAAEILIARGANVNRKTTDRMAPLHYAAARGFTDVVSLLLRAGAAVDPLDASDRTPLMLAVTRDHVDTVRLLIDHNAKVNIEEIHGYTPLCEAVWNKSEEVASLLLSSGAKLTQAPLLLHYTVLHRHLAMARLLLSHGAYPNLRDEHGNTPLLVAISCCHIPMIELLLQYDASPNFGNSILNLTPLLEALCHEAHFEEVLPLFCAYGVDLNLPGGGLLMPPLTWSLFIGKFRSAAALIRAGADVNKSSQCQWQTQEKSNLELALSKGPAVLTYLLVAAGFDLTNHKVDYPRDFSKLDVESIHGWLTYSKFNPRKLADLCRLRLRSQMGNKALELVPRLEIPRSLKQFLLFQDIY